MHASCTVWSVDDRLPAGAYDELITVGLDELMKQSSLETSTASVDHAETSEILGAHLEKVAVRVLDSLPFDRRLAVANGLLSRLVEESAAASINDLVPENPRMLWAVGAIRARPQNPLRRSDLLINACGEPVLHEELASEIVSADQVDLLCAFIKWQGLRLLVDAIERHCASGRTLRVITTTYVGATERRAVDELVRRGAQVKISYETRYYPPPCQSVALSA